MRKASWLFVLFAASPVLAQETSPIEVTATRTPQKIAVTPATVSVLTASALDQRGDTTLADALSAVPGVALVQSGGAGQPASLFVRGADSDQVLVLRDGVPVDDAASPAAAFDFGADLLGDVDPVEVVRGPLSGLYGSGAIGGVVALTTPQGSGAPRVALSLQAGAPRTLIGSARVRGTRGALDYALGAESLSTQGFDLTPKRMHYYRDRPDGYRAGSAYLNLGVTPAANTRLGLILRGRAGVAAYDNFGYDNPEGTARLNTLFARLSADTVLGNGALATGLAASVSRDDRRYSDPLLATDPVGAAERSSYRGTNRLLQWHGHLALLPQGGLDFGIEHGSASAKVASRTLSYGSPYDDQVAARRATDAGYGGLVTTLRLLTLSAQGREERDGGVGTAFTWRAGGSLSLPPLASALRASYGTGFKAPSLYDLFGIDSYGYTGNPRLRPERSDEAEIGLRSDLARHRVKLDVALFDQHLRDLITYVYAPAYTTENVGRSRITGIDASLSLDPSPRLGLVIAYTHLDPRDLSDHTLLIRRPRNKLALTARIQRGALTLSPELDYTGRAYDYLYDDDGAYTGTGLGQSGLVANLALRYRVDARLTLTATVRNLFDAHEEVANGYQIAGREGLAGVELAF